MTRVVLDTNIIVSALLSPRGAPAQVFSLATLDAGIQLHVSSDILAEYERVIRRPRFKLSLGEIEAALQAIRDSASLEQIASKSFACPDPGDNKFLDCAQAASAHYVVTGNARHFPRQWFGTSIVTPGQFLDEVL
jgi:putative PIN family toxin of toxin-antitoxin system